jgi:tetratricopeptide (TPR) repeat protein
VEEARTGGSGAEDRKPKQRGWPIQALRAYIRKHPRGWKKRWELARLLCAAGELEEAAQLLRGAVERQPRRIAIALELGEILERLGRAEEAIAAYEAALSWARDEGARAAIESKLATLRRRSAPPLPRS